MVPIFPRPDAPSEIHERSPAFLWKSDITGQL
jgi:hypothetical protein